MDKLPLELVDTILDHICYSSGVPDKPSLWACCLISRVWTGPSQRLLFRNVTIRGLQQGREHRSFCYATDPSTDRGRMLGQHVRVLEVHIGSELITVPGLDEADLVDILERTPRLYELALGIARIHRFSSQTMDRLTQLAASIPDGAGRTSLRIRALTILSCGIQSPIIYQLLELWPTIEFLHVGVELAAPPPKRQPQFRLYQLTLMRTPRDTIVSWLLSASTESLRILSFRDVPGRQLDPLLQVVGPKLRSLALMNQSHRSAAVLKHCPNLEEFKIVQLSNLFQLDNLPNTLEHLDCRNLPREPQPLDKIIHAVGKLPRLRAVTCDPASVVHEQFDELHGLCRSKGIELFLAEAPFWTREDPVYVERFPRMKSVANYALMN